LQDIVTNNAFLAIYLSHRIHPTKLYDTRPKENKSVDSIFYRTNQAITRKRQITKCMQTVERPKLSRSFETHQGYMYIGVSSFISDSTDKCHCDFRSICQSQTANKRLRFYAFFHSAQ